MKNKEKAPYVYPWKEKLKLGKFGKTARIVGEEITDPTILSKFREFALTFRPSHHSVRR